MMLGWNGYKQSNPLPPPPPFFYLDKIPLSRIIVSSFAWWKDSQTVKRNQPLPFFFFCLDKIPHPRIIVVSFAWWKDTPPFTPIHLFLDLRFVQNGVGVLRDECDGWSNGGWGWCKVDSCDINPFSISKIHSLMHNKMLV